MNPKVGKQAIPVRRTGIVVSGLERNSRISSAKAASLKSLLKKQTRYLGGTL